MTPVTAVTTPAILITRDASLDDLSTQDYRDIYEELRSRDAVTEAFAVSLDKFVALVTSQYSKAQWSKYHNGEATLTRTMRNELRRAVGLQLLPPTVAEATAGASPDAAVWQVGQGPADHVILVTSQAPTVLHVNGAVSVVEPASNPPAGGDVTGVTRTKRVRRYYARPAATVDQNGRREALGKSWREVIEAGLKSLERGGSFAGEL